MDVLRLGDVKIILKLALSLLQGLLCEVLLIAVLFALVGFFLIVKCEGILEFFYTKEVVWYSIVIDV